MAVKQKSQSNPNVNGEQRQGKPKKICPVSRAEFAKGAKPVLVAIGNNNLVAGIKHFATDSFGWYATGKIILDVGGVPVEVQVGLNLTCIGSKDLPK
jgi:hypothetical protein